MSAISHTPMPVTAVLLAGGRSERMGRDKALVDIGGRPLWQRQLALLTELSPAELIISGPRRREFPAAIRCREDHGQSRGPLSGLATALEAAAHPHVLLLAIDLPGMSTDFLHHLLGMSTPGRGVVPFHEEEAASRRFYEPLAAIYPRACLDLALSHLAGQDWSMQSFVRASVAAGLLCEDEIPSAAQPLFQNVNMPGDVESD